MIKKLAIIAASAFLLGGCTLSDIFKTNDAAKDQNIEVMSSATPMSSASPDVSLEAMPTTSTSTEVTNLEADINNTKILDEDFSDLN